MHFGTRLQWGDIWHAMDVIDGGVSMPDEYDIPDVDNTHDTEAGALKETTDLGALKEYAAQGVDKRQGQLSKYIIHCEAKGVKDGPYV